MRRILFFVLLSGLLTTDARAQISDLGLPARRSARPQATVRAMLNVDAFQPGQQAVLAVIIDIPGGHHAQSSQPLDEFKIPLAVTLADNPALRFSPPLYPPGEVHEYPALGRLSVYTGQVIVFVPMEARQQVSAASLKIEGTVVTQICNDKVCFPPNKHPFSIEAPILPPGQTTRSRSTTGPSDLERAEIFSKFDPATFARAAPPVPAAKPFRLFGYELAHDSYVFAFAAALVVGMIFNIMPCVLPVLPLKAIGFYEVSQHNRARSVALGAVFSAGLVATFAVLGLFVVVLQKLQWGQLFSNPLFLAGIVLLLTVFALSMFGVFTVNLPTAVYSFAPRHDTFFGNFLFGILTAILSTPCTFGMFLGLLIWASAQPAIIGMLLVIQVGAGMALPYLLLSAFPEVARRFPRTGPWAELVKQMMGFLLLLSAVYFARRFIEGFVGADAYWWSLFGVVAAAGLFLIVRTSQFSPRLQTRAIAVAIATILILPAGVFAYRITNPPIDWLPYTPQLLEKTRAEKRTALVEFTAAWCGNCLALEATVFHDEKVATAIRERGAVAIRVDLTDEDAPGWQLLKSVSPVGAIPLTIIYPPGTNEPLQLPGVYSAEDLLDALSRAASPRS